MYSSTDGTLLSAGTFEYKVLLSLTHTHARTHTLTHSHSCLLFRGRGQGECPQFVWWPLRPCNRLQGCAWIVVCVGQPPTTLDIPQKMATTLLPDCPNPVGVLGSKATGEPSYALGSSAFLYVPLLWCWVSFGHGLHMVPMLA